MGVLASHLPTEVENLLWLGAGTEIRTQNLLVHWLISKSSVLDSGIIMFSLLVWGECTCHTPTHWTFKNLLWIGARTVIRTQNLLAHWLISRLGQWDNNFSLLLVWGGCTCLTPIHWAFENLLWLGAGTEIWTQNLLAHWLISKSSVLDSGIIMFSLLVRGGCTCHTSTYWTLKICSGLKQVLRFEPRTY